MTERQQGKIKFFNKERGYGFIVPDAGGDDIFLHASAVSRAGISSVDEGDCVSFIMEESRGRMVAGALQKND